MKTPSDWHSSPDMASRTEQFNAGSDRHVPPSETSPSADARAASGVHTFKPVTAPPPPGPATPPAAGASPPKAAPSTTMSMDTMSRLSKMHKISSTVGAISSLAGKGGLSRVGAFATGQHLKLGTTPYGQRLAQGIAEHRQIEGQKQRVANREAMEKASAADKAEKAQNAQERFKQRRAAAREAADLHHKNRMDLVDKKAEADVMVEKEKRKTAETVGGMRFVRDRSNDVAKAERAAARPKKAASTTKAAPKKAASTTKAAPRKAASAAKAAPKKGPDIWVSPVGNEKKKQNG